MGRPGSGKSVLLGILGCLQRPDSGRLSIDDQELSQLTDNDLAWVRVNKVGFLAQDPNFKPNDTALKNVEAALRGQPLEEREQHQKAWAAIRLVGIEQRLAEQKLGLLSSGQRVGIGIARALVNDPPLLLADEPTKGLDSVARQEALDVFQKLNDSGKTIVIATSDSSVSRYCRRLVRIAEGRIVEDGLVSKRRVVTPSIGILRPGSGTSIIEELLTCPRCNYGNPKGQPNCQRCNHDLQAFPGEQVSPVAGNLPRVTGTNSQVAVPATAEFLSGVDIDSIIAGQRAAAAPSGAATGPEVATPSPAAPTEEAEVGSPVAEAKPAAPTEEAEVGSPVAEAKPAVPTEGTEISPRVTQDFVEIDLTAFPPQELLAELKKIPFFGKLGTRSLTRLFPYLQQRRYPKGSSIVSEGEAGDSYYVIRSGDAQVLAKGEVGTDMPIAQLGPQEGFGEMALLTDEPRYATVVALTELEVWRVTKTSFTDLLAADPSLVVYFNEVLRQRIRELNEKKYPST